MRAAPGDDEVMRDYVQRLAARQMEARRERKPRAPRRERARVVDAARPRDEEDDARRRVDALDASGADGEGDARDAEYERYAPTHGTIAGGPHPDPVVETGTLGKVAPPKPTYEHGIRDLCDSGGLSALQMECVTYACMRHEQRLPGERNERAGFFLGDGAGVGKGRQIAGLVYEHVRRGGRRVLWVSTSADLRYDAERDLNDLNAKPKVEVIPKNTAAMPRGDLSEHLDSGVVFSTYSLLTQGTAKVKKDKYSNNDEILKMITKNSRLEQFVTWLKEDERGPLIVFDECHKAKNLYNSGGKPTKTALCVVALQLAIPDARVLYCSATGASEPRNLGYMTRLGHFGWADTFDMLQKLESAGLGALEMFACGLKATGSYLCRTLSYEQAEFELVDCPISEELKMMYNRSTELWVLFKKVDEAISKLRGMGGEEWVTANEKSAKALNRLFWATHQRFYRQMLLCAKVPELAKLARKAVTQENLAVVIGLQSTGEASLTRMADEANDEGDEDFVSSPAEMLTNYLKNNFPTTSCRASANNARLWDTVLADVVRVVNTWCSQETIVEVLGRNPLDDNVPAANAVGAAARDDDIEVVHEKGLDEVLAERLEAAKLAGNFLDLTDDDIERRARNGVNEAQMRDLERMEEANAANEQARRDRLIAEERQLAELNRRRVEEALAAAPSPSSNDENLPPPMSPPPERQALVENRQQISQSGNKRSSRSDDGSDLPPNPRQKVAGAIRDVDIIEIDLTSSDDESRDAFNSSVQKRREEFARNGQILSGAAHTMDIPAPARPDAPVASGSGMHFSRANAPDPPKPAVNALERLRRFVPADHAPPRDAPRANAGVVRVKPEPVQGDRRRAAAPVNLKDEFANADAEDSDSDGAREELSDMDEPLPDDDVENQHLVHIRALLLRAVDSLQLPPNPLDNLIALCGGHEHVAEMTGRKLHQVRQENGKIMTRKRMDDTDAANAKLMNMTEKRKFQQGEKLIAIISDAASTGISLQADKRVQNQRRRCHMTLELPWSADKAIQQFGRSHRSNQSSAPLYRILMTPCGGERRFASSAAKRLLSLGALLKGDRRALGAGQSLQAFDIDNAYGSEALKRMISDLKRDTDPMPTVQYTEAQLDAIINIIRGELVKVGLADEDNGDGRFTLKGNKTKNSGLKISTFLNRLLGMPIEMQEIAFDYFTQTFEGVIKDHKQRGKYDSGVTNITGQSIVSKPEHNKVVHKCPTSGAETNVRLVVSDSGVKYRQVCAMMRDYEENRETLFEGSNQRGLCGFYIATYGTMAKTNRPNVCYAHEIRNMGQQNQNSIKNPQMQITRANKLNASKMDLDNLQANYKRVELTDIDGVLRFRELWNFWYDFFKSTCVHGKTCKQGVGRRMCDAGKRFRNDLLICGAVLPVWNQINDQFKGMVATEEGTVRETHLKVMRAQTTLGEKIVGLKLASIAVEDFDDYVRSLQTTIEDRTKGGVGHERHGGEIHYDEYYDDDDLY